MSAGAPTEIETGVCSGDVDWLFRGKSKKLEKKLNSERKLSVSVAAERTEVPEKNTLADGSAQETAERAGILGPDTGQYSDTHVSVKLMKTPEPSKQPFPSLSVANMSSKETVKTVEQGQDLPGDRVVGRLRSSSAPHPPKVAFPQHNMASPSSPKAHITVPQRRSSVNVASSSNSNSMLSNSQEHKRVSQHQQQPQSPILKSNSGRGRSFFSNLTLKFKSSPFSATTSSSATSAPPISPTTNSTVSSLSSISSFKTPLATSQLERDQDLSSVKKPPSEIGIAVSPGIRNSHRSSLVSLSPRSSVDKERGGFFRRRSSVSESLSSTYGGTKRIPKQVQKPPKPKVHLRRVSFALDKLDDDPQQQIPSRRPRKGNVIIPEDLKAPPPRLSFGISTNYGSKSASTSDVRYSEREMQMAIEAQAKALMEAEKHAVEAHLSAKKLACQIASYKVSNKASMAYVDEEEVVEGMGKIEIDNPLHMHENHFEDNIVETSNDEAKDLSPETVYTRCCHLREILPIPATLKQLKNKSKPLQILKMLNPKPTLIDVLSFSDFISITPMNTVIFDNVTMTTEMLKHVLSALVHNTCLEKLSLRNVAIDEEGWGYLCEFLSRNHILKKLDISQQRVKSLTSPTSYRAFMNWDLFITSLRSRNGIEELVMGGCKLNNDVFESLLETALTIATCRLGMAATEINVRKCEMLADWMSRPDSKCVGIDIAYNDLSQGQLRPFIDTFNTKVVNLLIFSLNSTSLTDVEEVGELLKGLTRVQSLRFLDFSSLPQLFPHVISKIGKYLPGFQSLRRVHFDLNDLTSQSISALADVFPKVPNLVHVSLLGNKNLDRGSIGALYTAVKSSSLFTLDLDYDLVPDELSQRLALYLMRNFDKVVKPNIDDYADDNKPEDVMFDGSLLMETAEKMLMESEQNTGAVDLKLQKIITNALIERTNSVRKEMHRVIDKLFEKRNHGNLSFEGKENLLRFCLLDASLEKLVDMFEQKAKMYSSTTLSPSPSIQEAKITMEPDGSTRKQLHSGSTALIDASSIMLSRTSNSNNINLFQGNESTLQPHSVSIDAHSDGRNVIIDNLTGRPVLIKSVSQTSIHARQQEQEEGEFLRWGYFIEHRNNEMKLSEPDDVKQEVSCFAVVPSGSELREAIIAAKGVESVTDLISKINNQRVSLDNIYTSKSPKEGSPQEYEAESPLMMRCKTNSDHPDKIVSEDDNASIDSCEKIDVNPVVNEVYEKLLNEAQRVMSNK